MKTKKVFILGAGIMQVPIIRKAVELGYEVLVADYNENAPGFQFAHKKYTVSTLDQESILKIATREKIDGILTTSDAPVKVVAYVAKKLGLPAMSEDVSEICTNKYLQRKVFKNNGINCPEFYLCDNYSNIDSLDSFPYIVKPVDSSASRGVRKVNNKEELCEAVTQALPFSSKSQVIIESYIPGREFSVETLTQKGKTDIIAITEKLTGGDEGFFVESTHIQPARVSHEEKAIISKEILMAIDAIGIDNCPTHTEIKINSDGAHIIEIACRLGGDYITSDLVPLSTGVDMLGNLINLSLGKPISVLPQYSKSSAVQFINPENYTKCKNFITYNPNEIVRYEISDYSKKPVRNSMDRLGYIILQKDTIQEIELELKKIK